MNVKIMYWDDNLGAKYMFTIGKVIRTKLNKCNFTKVLVKLFDGSEKWVSPAILEITAKKG